MTKTLCWLLMFVVLLTSLSACGKNSEENGKASYQTNKLDVYSENDEKEATLIEIKSTGEIDYSFFVQRGIVGCEDVNDLFPFKYKNKVGYADANGNIVIESKYDSASYFCDEKAFVETADGIIEIIDMTGKTLYSFGDDFEWEYLTGNRYANGFSDGFSEVYDFYDNTLILSYFDIRKGEIIIHVIYDNNDKIEVEKHIISNVPYQYSTSASAICTDSFKGVVLRTWGVEIGKDTYNATIYDISGEIIAEYSRDNVNQTLHTAFDKFDKAPSIYIKDDYINIMNDDSLWGIMNLKTKEMLVDCKYDYIGKTNENCIPVCSYGKWGAINKRGETTIAFEYDYIGNFSNNKAFAVKNGIECYIINQNGDIEYTYTNTNFLTGRYHNYLPYDFSEKTGIAMVKNEDYYYLITNTGKTLLQDNKKPFVSDKYVFTNGKMYEIVMHSVDNSN